MSQKPLVFLCMPRYSSTVHAGAHRAFLAASKGACQVSFGTEGIGGSPIESQTSVLTQAFNQPWVMALNLRDAGHPITHFAMQHADVEPEYGWLDVLVSEQQRLGADVVSSVIPHKTANGVTSTALGDPSWSPTRFDTSERPRRLTLQEAHKLPPTFSASDVDPAKILLLNTGCWVCRFDEPWVEKITFRFHNLNFCNPSLPLGHRWHTACRTEDFDASLQWNSLGRRVFATTLVKIQHHGDTPYPNYHAFGWATDEDYVAEQAKLAKV